MLHCLPVVSPNHSLPYRHLVLRWRLLVLWANNLNYSSFPKHLLYFSYEFVSFLLSISQHSCFLHCMSRAVPGAASTCGIFKLPFFIILIWSLGLALRRFFFSPAFEYFSWLIFCVFFSFSTYFYKYRTARTVHNVPTSVSLQLCANVKLHPYFHYLLLSFYIRGLL